MGGNQVDVSLGPWPYRTRPLTRTYSEVLKAIDDAVSINNDTNMQLFRAPQNALPKEYTTPGQREQHLVICPGGSGGLSGQLTRTDFELARFCTDEKL